MITHNSLDFCSKFQQTNQTAIMMPSSLAFPLTLHLHHYPLTPSSFIIIIIIHQPHHHHHHLLLLLLQLSSPRVLLLPKQEAAQDQPQPEAEAEAEEEEKEGAGIGFITFTSYEIMETLVILV
ncbi:hypothetical protein ACE6H2_018057 [Prunus campanulata]